jgi:hypothetical protein
MPPVWRDVAVGVQMAVLRSNYNETRVPSTQPSVIIFFEIQHYKLPIVRSNRRTHSNSFESNHHKLCRHDQRSILPCAKHSWIMSMRQDHL